MKELKKPLRSLPLFLTMLFTACVTINIYFPAAAAEKAADRIIQDVWSATGQLPTSQLPDGSSDLSDPSAPPDSASEEPQTQSALGFLFDFLVNPAYAQADLNVSTPAIQNIQGALKARYPQLAPYYANGAIGLTNRALITQRDAASIPLKDRNKVKQLVSAENNDRNALYREIAKANGHPEWEANIRDTFARRWVANAGAQWWYQDGNGAWKQR
jgi:hypothetical protein